MNVGSVDVHANHAVVFLGSEEWPDVEDGDAPAACDGRHLVVRTRGQFGHTRVSLPPRSS